MGHLRLGRLPKTRRWIEVVELLEADPTDAARVTGATVVAAETHLRSLPSNEPLTYAFWLLLRIATASRSETFVQDVRGLGLSVTAETSALELISEVADELRGRFRGGDSATAEFASLAVRRALTETVGSFGGSLFGSTVDDLQSAFRRFSTKDQFSEVAYGFFADFTARLLTSYLDRELSNHVEGSISERMEVASAIDLHARQSAAIMREFAGGWYSKQNWETKGEITLDDAQRFVAVALRKLRMELQQESA